MKSLDLAIILKLVDKVTTPLKGVVGGFGKVKTSVDKAVASVSRFDRVSAAVQRTSDRLRGMAAMAAKAGAALALVTGIGGGAISLDATGITAKFEDMYATLDTLYQGNEGKVRQAQSWIKDFATTTPFEVDGITEAFTRLKAYGMDPMDGTLRTLGDTSAAMGKDVMAAVEMMSDAIMGENERLKEFGIKGTAIQGTDYIQYDYIDKAGKQQKRQVLKNDKQQIQRVLTEIFDDKYAGAMEKRSKTFNGILSNIKDTFSNLQMQFMNAGLFDFLKQGLQGKLDMLTALAKSGKVEAWGKQAAHYLRLASGYASDLSGTVMDAASQLAAFAGGWKNLGMVGAGAGGLWLFRDLIFAITAGVGALPLLLAGVTASLVDWEKLLPRIWQMFHKLLPKGGLDFLRIKGGLRLPPGGLLQIRDAALEAVQARLRTLQAQLAPLAAWFRKLTDKAVEFGRQALKALSGVKFDKLLPVIQFGFSLTPFHLLMGAGKSLLAVLAEAFAGIRRHLPILRRQFADVFGVIGRWLKDNASTVRATLSGVMLLAVEKLSQGLAFLSAKARDGSLRAWLDTLGQKLRPVLDNVLAFGRGVWETALKIGKFTAKFTEFIGGWDKLAMVLAGGWVIAALSGFLQGLGALLGIIAFLASPVGLLVALIAALAIGARYVYLEWNNMTTGSKVLAVALGALGVGILALVAYLKIAARWTAITATAQKVWNAVLWLGRAAMVAFRAISLVGMLMAMAASFTAAGIAAGIASAGTWLLAGAVAVLTSPITLVIGLIALLAAGAYYLYQNWDTIKPMLLAFWEDVKAAWETFKTWVSGLIDSVVQIFWSGWEKVKTYTVDLANSIVTFFASLPAKMLEVGSNIINGLWDGLKSSSAAVVDWMAGLGNDIINSAKGVLGINSPSRVFAEIGGFTVEGMQQGMETAQPKLFSFLDGFGDKLKGWWKGVADAFTGDDLAANIGKAFEVTKNALPSLPAPVSNAIEAAASVIPGVGAITTVSKVVSQIGKQNSVSGLIHWGESKRRGYNDYNRGSDRRAASNKQNLDLTQMSVGQIMQMQALPIGSVNRLFAVGKYQVIPDTLKEAVSALHISQTDKFTPQLQEKIFTEHLASRKRPQIEKYIKGSGSLENASHAVAQEWASVASIKTGRGLYDGVGVNHAGIKAQEMTAALQVARAEYAKQRAAGTDDKTAYALALGAKPSDNTPAAVSALPNLPPVAQLPSNPIPAAAAQAVTPVKNLSQDTGEGVHPHLMAVYQRASALAKQQGDTIIIKDALRTVEEQAKYVREGHSKTMNSRHIPAANGVGHALDLTMPYQGAQSDKQDWVQVRKVNEYMQNASKELNIPIEWGGDWKSFKDGFHWQLPWKAYAANKAVQSPVIANTPAAVSSLPNLPPVAQFPSNLMPPAAQMFISQAANDPLFQQTLAKTDGLGGATAVGDSTVVPFARPSSPIIAPQQTISITINAAPGMTAQDIAAEVQRVLRDEQRRAEAKYRGRAYD